MEKTFDGLDLHLGNLARLSNARSRSISAENFDGEKGKGGMATTGTGAIVARDLGQGWKVSPSIHIAGKSTAVLADIAGPGVIQHIWLTVHPSFWRRLVLRMYWDNEETPSVETPLGDFFSNGWCERCNVNSISISVNPAGGFNSYWQMPFRKHARITVENLGDEEVAGFYYSVDYALTEIPQDMAYLHTQFRLSKPLPYKEVHTILEGVQGWGHYVGVYMAIAVHDNGWWGEGEIKFFMDGDQEFPTICGTGTEDYFGGAWNFEFPQGQYGVFSGPYLGLPQVIKPDGLYRSTQRFGMYRWHIQDPIRFEKDLRVTIQDLGWLSSRTGGQPRYLPRQDTIATTAFWYQQEPHAAFPELASMEALEVT
jgi:hypothetical protein